MANMANTHCPECGYNFAAFGRVHRCIPRVRPEAAADVENEQAVGPAVSRDVARPGTYKYRDRDKRRAYMRDLMRRRREKA